MNPSLILVRHSTPAIDPMTPSTNWRLNSAGVDAARRLASQIVSFNPVCLLSSPERKARETAEIIGESSSLDIQFNDDLQEHKRTSSGFLSIGNFNGGIAALFSSPEVVAFGDESAIAVFARVSAALPTPGSNKGTAVVVTHGTALSIYMSQTFGIDGFAFWQSLRTPMAIIVRPNGWSVLFPEGSESR